MNQFGEKLRYFLPGSKSTPEGKLMAFILLFIVSFVIACIIIGFVTFGITMKGHPVVSVPHLSGLELADAMEMLQDYGLVAEVHQRGSKKRLPRGVVFAQHPRSGANIKMGGKVIISVSRGFSDIELDDFVGKQIDEVIEKIQSINQKSEGEELLSLNQSFIYDATVPKGEVITQNPVAHSHLFRPTQLDLQISAGKWNPDLKVPSVIGKNYQEVIDYFSANEIPFNFVLSKVAGTAGTVIAQTPTGGKLLPVGEAVEIQIAKLPNRKDHLFGIFTCELPRYAIPMEVKITSKPLKGIETDYFTVKHPGGTLSFPYYAVEGTTFFVNVEGTEVTSFNVQ